MGIEIKVMRIKKGLKQKDLAEKVGISSQYMMQIEKGKAKNPSIEIMKKIAMELNASVYDLFFNETVEEDYNRVKEGV